MKWSGNTKPGTFPNQNALVRDPARIPAVGRIQRGLRFMNLPTAANIDTPGSGM